MSLTIRELGREAQKNSRAKGFVSDDPRIGLKLMLTVTELGEALEEVRNNHLPTEVYYSDPYPYSHPTKPEGFLVELADAVIRISQLAEHVCELALEAGVEVPFDLQDAIELKLAYNETRPKMHGGKQF